MRFMVPTSITGPSAKAKNSVVFVHGWMVSGAIFDSIIELLDRTDLKLIVPDLHGTGGSDKPATGYQLESYAQDVLAVLDAEGVESCALIGHSMGGQVTQWLAANHPGRVHGAMMMCSVPASGIELPEEAQQLFRTSGNDRDKQRTIVSMSCRDISEAATEAMLNDAATIPATCIAESFDAWRVGGFAEQLANIRCPSLVVATDDPFLPPAFLKQAIVDKIPGARLAVLPGPGHYLQVERPKETTALISAFLVGCSKA